MDQAQDADNHEERAGDPEQPIRFIHLATLAVSAVLRPENFAPYPEPAYKDRKQHHNQHDLGWSMPPPEYVVDFLVVDSTDDPSHDENDAADDEH